jgi:L-ascorbate metabolism protein UlaG (beta-lactamase superfamily)
MPDVALTWLGHATYRIDSPEGKRIYVDPFLTGNPACPDGEEQPERLDILAITHGHGDHLGDTVELIDRFSPQVVAQVEVKAWLKSQGSEVGELPGINKGGSQEIDGIRFTMTDARHSSSAPDGTYLGEASGYVITFENGTKVYFAGDTSVFGDMQLIARIYQPDVAVLPIGDWFTMGPEEAAVALELLGVQRCVPCHYGTFPVLTGTPAKLRELAPYVELLEMQPGETLQL